MTTREKFLDQYQKEIEKGLKSIHYFPGDISQTTINDFLAESLAIDQAIIDGRHSPLDETF